MKRLLLIDDEPAVLQPMTRYFARMGYDVLAARGRDEAILGVAAGGFDVVILDLRLGDGVEDGLDVLRRIHAQRAPMPVLVLSGLVTADIRAELAGLGVGGVLQKPQPLAEIARVADELIAARITTAPIGASNLDRLQP